MSDFIDLGHVVDELNWAENILSINFDNADGVILDRSSSWIMEARAHLAVAAYDVDKPSIADDLIKTVLQAVGVQDEPPAAALFCAVHHGIRMARDIGARCVGRKSGGVSPEQRLEMAAKARECCFPIAEKMLDEPSVNDLFGREAVISRWAEAAGVVAWSQKGTDPEFAEGTLKKSIVLLEEGLAIPDLLESICWSLATLFPSKEVARDQFTDLLDLVAQKVPQHVAELSDPYQTVNVAAVFAWLARLDVFEDRRWLIETVVETLEKNDRWLLQNRNIRSLIVSMMFTFQRELEAEVASKELNRFQIAFGNILQSSESGVVDLLSKMQGEALSLFPVLGAGNLQNLARNICTDLKTDLPAQKCFDRVQLLRRIVAVSPASAATTAWKAISKLGIVPKVYWLDVTKETRLQDQSLKSVATELKLVLEFVKADDSNISFLLWKSWFLVVLQHSSRLVTHTDIAKTGLDTRQIFDKSLAFDVVHLVTYALLRNCGATGDDAEAKKRFDADTLETLDVDLTANKRHFARLGQDMVLALSPSAKGFLGAIKGGLKRMRGSVRIEGVDAQLSREVEKFQETAVDLIIKNWVARRKIEDIEHSQAALAGLSAMATDEAIWGTLYVRQWLEMFHATEATQILEIPMTAPEKMKHKTRWLGLLERRYDQDDQQSPNPHLLESRAKMFLHSPEWSDQPHDAFDSLVSDWKVDTLPDRQITSSTKCSYWHIPWLKGAQLARFFDDAWDIPNLVRYGIISGGVAVELVGEADIIHQMNQKCSINLHEENVIDYLRFFCFFTRHAEQPFYIAISPDDPMVSVEDENTASDHLFEVFSPPKVIGKNRNGDFVCLVTVVYDGGCFQVEFAVALNGLVSVIEEEQLPTQTALFVNYPIGKSLGSEQLF